jgi:hypothetical protein
MPSKKDNVAMARLVIRADGFQDQVIELRLGVNRVGRSPENDFQIEHPTVSSLHCELMLSDGELHVRDCDSTNHTFVCGEPISHARLVAGQSFCIGDVEMFIENTDVKVAIPKFDVQRPAPPIVLTDGSLICPRHPEVQVTHQCLFCREVMCDACVHRLRRRGGTLLKLCCLCSHEVEQIGGSKKKKKSLLGFLQRTVKLPFLSKRVE